MTGRMMVKMAEAIGRLVLSGRELTRLAGYVVIYWLSFVGCIK